MKNITGILIYNQSMYSETYQKMLDLYVTAGRTLSVDMEQKSNLNLLPAVINGRFSLHLQPDLYDFCIFLDKDVELARQIQEMGIPVYNAPEAIASCDNKIAMSQQLLRNNVPICDSFFSTTQFFTVDETDFRRNVVEILGFPLVIKEAYGSFGEQVYLAENLDEMNTIRNKIGNKPYLYQRFMAHSRGRDLRIYVCDGNVIGAMKRQNLQDFRANISNGGEILPYTPTLEEKNLAISANYAMGSLFSGVDIFWDEEGKPVVCEVNASAHIKYYQEFTGENLAVPILKAIISKL